MKQLLNNFSQVTKVKIFEIAAVLGIYEGILKPLSIIKVQRECADKLLAYHS